LIYKTNWFSRGARIGIAFYVLKYKLLLDTFTENDFFNTKIEGPKLLESKTHC